MPEKEQQDKTLSELVVKEAVEKGMDSPMRDSILEAVEEAEGGKAGSMRSLPIAGALFGLGAAVGFLAGRESPDLQETSIEDVQEPEVIGDVMETGEEQMTETEDEEMEAESSSRLPRALLVLGVLAGAALLRRRLAGSEEEEWEPIEEFEPATSMGDESESEDDEEADAESDDGESDSEDEIEE